MKFKSYTDIENAYNSKFITLLRKNNCDNEDITYVCEVKIDGSNYQCSIDETGTFITGSRSHLLNPREDFQGSLNALREQDIQTKLIKLKKIICERFSHIEAVKQNNFVLTVYGELCGGMYRHKDVERVPGSKKIQGRVSYHPNNVWIPFDIIIRDIENTNLYVFGPFEAKEILKEVDLPYTIILFQGTFNDCLNFPNTFIDPIGSKLFGLPEIENNITEGVVIKPIKPAWVGNERVILKNKNEKFKEHVCKTPKEKKELPTLNELELKYFNILREYITESRLYSVFSKLDDSQINQKMFGYIQGLYVKDVFTEFEKTYSKEITELESTLPIEEFNFAKAKKLIAKEIVEIIRPVFLEKLNN